MPRSINLNSAVLFAALLAGCAVEPAQEPTPPIVLQPSITEVLRPPPVIEKVMSATWTFEGGETCRATATGSGRTLALTADRVAATVALRFRAADALRGAMPLRLSGPAGSWNLPARTSGRTVWAARAMDEDAASRMLVLLSGGSLVAGRLGGLKLPNAGEAGRAWFECVRRQLLP